MAGKATVRHYFAEGLTLRGYISLLPNMMPAWQRTYVLMGGPGTGKSTMIKVLGLDLLDRGFDVNFLRSAQEPDSMAGFVLPRNGLAMIDGLEVAPLRGRAPGIIEKYVDFTLSCDGNKLEQRRAEILHLSEMLKNQWVSIQEELLTEFGEGFRGRKAKYFRLRDKEAHCIEEIDTVKNAPGPWPVAAHALEELQHSCVNPCFLHGLTPNGWLNLAPHFLNDCDQIRLEGEETGDALAWLLEEAMQLGQIIEIVLHPLNPDETIGIVFPERHLAIWHGHPQQLQDQDLAQEFGPALKLALEGWSNQRTALKNLYTETVDFAKIDNLREELLNDLLRELDEQKY